MGHPTYTVPLIRIVQGSQNYCIVNLTLYLAHTVTVEDFLLRFRF